MPLSLVASGRVDIHALDHWFLVLLPPGKGTSEMLRIGPPKTNPPFAVRCLGSGDAARVSPCLEEMLLVVRKGLIPCSP